MSASISQPSLWLLSVYVTVSMNKQYQPQSPFVDNALVYQRTHSLTALELQSDMIAERHVKSSGSQFLKVQIANMSLVLVRRLSHTNFEIYI